MGQLLLKSMGLFGLYPRSLRSKMEAQIQLYCFRVNSLRLGSLKLF